MTINVKQLVIVSITVKQLGITTKPIKQLEIVTKTVAALSKLLSPISAAGNQVMSRKHVVQKINIFLVFSRYFIKKEKK